MFTTKSFSRFAQGFSQARTRTIEYLTIAALSCVLVQAQTATKYVVGYWEGSGTPNVGHLTHLNYAFASITGSSGSYTCTLSNAATLKTQFHSFKATNPNLKILISVGGEGSGPTFSSASKDSKFASRCVAATVTATGADGIDIDWEFPASSTDETNFGNLMSALHTALPSGGLLTAAIGLGPTDNGQTAQDLYVPFTTTVLADVNFFNIMAYGTDSTAETTFTAPLYASSITGYGTYNGTVYDTIHDLLVTKKLPADKFVLGIPFYGVSYPSVPSEGPNAGLYQPPVAETVKDPISGKTGKYFSVDIPYNQIVPELTRSTVTKYCDAGATTATKCPTTWGQPLSTTPTAGAQETWIYDTNSSWGFGPSVTTFDDAGSMAAKVKYALANQLAGVMVWELMQDTSTSTLLNAIWNSLPDQSLYNFEAGMQGWTTSTPYTKIGISPAEAFLGTRSLAITMGNANPEEYSPTTIVYVASPAIKSTQHTVTFRIWVPAAAKLSAIDPFLADSNWNYVAGAWTSTPTRNAWNTYTVQIPEGVTVSYLGVEVDSNAFWFGSCFVDSIAVQ